MNTPLLRTTLVLISAALLSGCWGEDWIVVDKQARPNAMFWGVVHNFDGNPISSIEISLNETGRTAFTVTSPPPVFEVHTVSVTGLFGFGGERNCGYDCPPRDGDVVMQLEKVEWPFVYRFEFD